MNDHTIDLYDRTLGVLDGLPGVAKTQPATVQIVTPMVGNVQTFTVRTIRQQDHEQDSEGKDKALPPQFTVLIEQTSKDGVVRMVLPHKVSEIIARQREALTTMARKKLAKKLAAERTAKGIVPGFLKGKKKK